MKNPYLLACFLLLPLVLGLTLQEDDLVFDDVGEDSASTAATVVSHRYDDSRTSWHDYKRQRDADRHQVERLWGVPHVVVPVGHELKLRIPRQPFTEPADYYQVRRRGYSRLIFFPPRIWTSASNRVPILYTRLGFIPSPTSRPAPTLPPPPPCSFVFEPHRWETDSQRGWASPVDSFCFSGIRSATLGGVGGGGVFLSRYSGSN